MINILKYIIATLFNWKKSKAYYSKIKHVYTNVCKTDKISIPKKIIKEHDIYWRRLTRNFSDKWIKVFSTINNKADIHYVPETIYYTIIEPVLNNRQLTKAYADKNFYDLYFDKNIFPNTILRNLDGRFYTKSFEFITLNDPLLFTLLNPYEKIIIKPSIDSGGGFGISLFIRQNDKFIDQDGNSLSLNLLLKKFYQNYIVQEYIHQHSFFQQFNETSLNTVRIFTYRSVVNNEIIPLHSVLRIGKKGVFVDNQASGGISVGINPDGLLNNFAIDKYGNKYNEINSVTLNSGLILPLYHNMLEIAKELAPKNLYARLLGFDFCLDQNSNIKIVEINNVNNEINFFQMNNGPLFGTYTDEIIEHCQNNYKTFALDFMIK